MALSEELPIFGAAYSLLEKIIDLSKDLPKMLRFTVGSRIVDANLDLLMHVYRTNMTDDRQSLFNEMLISQRMIQMLLRVVYREKAISSGRYAELLKLLDTIGRQITAWKKNDGTGRSD